MTSREGKKLAAKRLELDELDLDKNPSDEKKLHIEILELEIKILEHPEKDQLLIPLLTEKEKTLNLLRSNPTTGMVCCSRAQILSSTPPTTTPAPTTHNLQSPLLSVILSHTVTLTLLARLLWLHYSLTC